jgi:predicted transcriptional regulator
MDKCKICGREFKNLGVHVKNAHKMSMDEYNTTFKAKDEVKPIEEVESDIVTPTQRKEGIFGKDEDILLSEFLEMHDITRKELENLVKRYVAGSSIPVTQMQERQSKIALSQAEAFKDQKEVKTNSVSIAENLVKNYNFEVTAVTSGPPKTWHLNKRDS